MKTTTIYFAGIIILIAMGSQTSIAQTKIIAHRGFWNTEQSAQNSLTALKKAYEEGLYGSEFDVWLTADGIPVVNHDHEVDSLIVEESTYEQLQTITLSNGEKIPTLEQYLQLGKKLDGLQLILEIKPHKRIINEDRLVAQIVEMVRRYGLENRTDYISFSMNICKELRKCAPYSRVVYLRGDVSPADLKEIGLTGLDYSYKALSDNPEWISEAKKLKLTTNVWTVNDTVEMERYIRFGIDFITTDNPLELKALLYDN